MTESESPGSAPRTKIGPVALLRRSVSSFSSVSDSDWTCPVKQSNVSSSITVPGSTVKTGVMSAENAHTCCSLGILTSAASTTSSFTGQFWNKVSSASTLYPWRGRGVARVFRANRKMHSAPHARLRGCATARSQSGTGQEPIAE